MKRIVFDVRSQSEYSQGHICGAINVPLGLPPTGRNLQAFKQNLTYLSQTMPPNAPISVYCKKGIRAGIAKQLLRQMGMRNVQNLGGLEDIVAKNNITLCR